MNVVLTAHIHNVSLHSKSAYYKKIIMCMRKLDFDSQLEICHFYELKIQENQV